MNSKEETFLALVRPQARRLQSVARQYAADVSRVEDLVQETFLRAWRNFSPLEGSHYAFSWLVTILRNVALEWRRQASSRVRLTLMADAELTDLQPADEGEPFSALPAMSEARFREFLDDHVAAAMDALPEPYREVLVLSVAGDLTYKEIADVLRCPIGTVMSRMGRARRILREQLSRQAGGGAAAAGTDTKTQPNTREQKS